MKKLRSPHDSQGGKIPSRRDPYMPDLKPVVVRQQSERKTLRRGRELQT